MNEFRLFGRVGRDPETRQANGKNVVNLSIATDNGKDQSGQKREPTWHRLTAWEKTADLIAKYVKKGDLLLVEGRITTRERTIGDKKINEVSLTVSHIEFGGGNGGGSSGQAQAGSSRRAAPRSSEPTPVGDEDIPF